MSRRSSTTKKLIRDFYLTQTGYLPVRMAALIWDPYLLPDPDQAFFPTTDQDDYLFWFESHRFGPLPLKTEIGTEGEALSSLIRSCRTSSSIVSFTSYGTC